MTKSHSKKFIVYGVSKQISDIKHPITMNAIPIFLFSLTFAVPSSLFRSNQGTFTLRKNSALASGSAVFMYIPVPSSNPAIWETLGTIATYQ